MEIFFYLAGTIEIKTGKTYVHTAVDCKGNFKLEQSNQCDRYPYMLYRFCSQPSTKVRKNI